MENGTVKMSIECMIILANELEVSLDELFEKSLTFKGNQVQNSMEINIKECTDDEKHSLEIILSKLKTDSEAYMELLQH